VLPAVVLTQENRSLIQNSREKNQPGEIESMKVIQNKEMGSIRSRLMLASMVAVAVAFVGTKVLADDATDIEQFYSTGSLVQYDNTSGAYPIITAVASMPGVFSGHTYTGWSLLAQDSTGSLDLFTSAFTLTNLTGAGAGTAYSSSLSPAVGDAINSAGQWSPFDQIPELSFTTTVASNNFIHRVSTGNTVPTVPVFNVSQVNIPNISNHIEFAGTLIEVMGVTITPGAANTNGNQTVFPTYAQASASFNNETYTMTDGSGGMTMFDWVTSYSACAMHAGGTVPTGPVNVWGFVDDFGSTAEFVPLSFTPVPEPSSILLAVSGLLGLLVLRRRRS